MTKIPVEIGKKKLARRQYSMMGSEIGNNNRTNGLHTKCRRQHIVKIYKNAFYTLIQIQIQIFYLLITVPIAEQNNQTMKKHRYLYDWVDWLQI
jgi:hypothetical protein